MRRLDAVLRLRLAYSFVTSAGRLGFRRFGFFVRTGVRQDEHAGEQVEKHLATPKVSPASGFEMFDPSLELLRRSPSVLDELHDERPRKREGVLAGGVGIVRTRT